MKISYIIPVFLFICMACKRPSPPTIVYTPTSESPGPVVAINSLPMSVGNMWVYDNKDTMRIVADTLIFGTTVKKVTVSNTGHVHISYYANVADGLYLYGTNGYPYSLISPGGSAPDDSVTWFSYPMHLLRYPVILNEPWNTNEPHTTNAFNQWTAYVTIGNAAGTFNCIKLFGNNTTSYFSADHGLVRVVVQPECFTTPCPPIVTNLVYVNF